MRAEPSPGLPDEAAHHAAYLAFYRETFLEKVASLPEAELRVSQVPSGWTPLALLRHVEMMERRWFRWGFLGEQVDDPWGDSQGDPDGPWFVDLGLTLADVAAALRDQGERTAAVLATYDLDVVASAAGRFRGTEPPTLRWICFHVLQEYARHAGHLDIVVELAGGPRGE